MFFILGSAKAIIKLFKVILLSSSDDKFFVTYIDYLKQDSFVSVFVHFFLIYIRFWQFY